MFFLYSCSWSALLSIIDFLVKCQFIQIIFFLNLMVTGPHCNAQVKLGLGVFLQPQWSYTTYSKSFINQYDGNDNFLVSAGYGIHADLQFNKWLAIESGIGHNSKGMILRVNPLRKLQLNYLSIPLNLKFKIPVSERFSLDYLLGFYYFRLGSVNIDGREQKDHLFRNSGTSFLIGHEFTFKISQDWSLF